VARHKLANGFATTDELVRTKAALREQEGEGYTQPVTIAVANPTMMHHYTNYQVSRIV
jgi:hypothetical protein